MAIIPGTRLGPYEILGPLGAGGMGEVYKARDTRLDRTVAIKVLPEHLAGDPGLRARFEREAKSISALNHPHICTLHDVGHQDGTDFLVMEYLEGDSLATRLERGALPIAEVLSYGIQIADALDKAHRQGLIHRDLKPGNIMLTRSGAKLLDFGLARALAPGPTGASLSQTPTMSQPLTAAGSIVGTFQYMAPEQLEGQEADARTDLFALGSTLYEMATGKKAFEGRSQASLIAAILEKDPPPISSVDAMTPPGLDRLVRACLAKDPEQRIQTAHDVKLQLQWIAEGGSQAGVPAPVATRRRSRERVAWVLAAAGLTATLLLAVGAWLQRPAPARVVRFSVDPGRGVATAGWPRISPDGRLLAYQARDSAGVQKIWIRPLDALEAHSLPGTENAGRPFWSPDSRFLAYFVDGKLRKVPIGGGPAVTIADAPGGADGSWGRGGLIIFDGNLGDSLRVVPASGGTVKPASTFDRTRGESGHGWPFFLPDGKHYLYVSSTRTAASLMVLAEIGSDRTVELGPCDGRVEYSPQGYLVFPREGTLMAQAFDARANKTRGDPVPIGENLTMGGAEGHFGVSNEGTLVYRAEQGGTSSQLIWMDRAGRSLGSAAPPGGYQDIALSPDGRRVAVTILDSQSGSEDIWVREMARNVTTRLTFSQDREVWPIWSPDGTRIAYAVGSGEFRLMTRLSSGLGGEDSLYHVEGGREGPTDWSRDGTTILTSNLWDGSQWDVGMLRLAPGQKASPLLQTRFSERNARFSPDGRWMAYQSNEAGQPEIFIQGLSGAGGKWQVSTGGGVQPHWRSDGKELFFRGLDQTIMAAPIAAGATLEVGAPVVLFRARLVELSSGGIPWDVTADGQRFLLNVPAGGGDDSRFTVVMNWVSDLGR